MEKVRTEVGREEGMKITVHGSRVVEQNSDGSVTLELSGVRPFYVNGKFLDQMSEDLQKQGFGRRDAGRMMDAASEAIHQEALAQLLKDRVVA